MEIELINQYIPHYGIWYITAMMIAGILFVICVLSDSRSFERLFPPFVVLVLMVAHMWMKSDNIIIRIDDETNIALLSEFGKVKSVEKGIIEMDLYKYNSEIGNKITLVFEEE